MPSVEVAIEFDAVPLYPLIISVFISDIQLIENIDWIVPEVRIECVHKIPSDEYPKQLIETELL
jgi:hypothetical protein